MTKHTPGKWETGSTITRVEVWPEGWNAPICIADCHDKNAPEDEAERVSNARLIAAAPEMLEVLRAFIRADDNMMGLETVETIIQDARAIIQKVEGL